MGEEEKKKSFQFVDLWCDFLHFILLRTGAAPTMWRCQVSRWAEGMGSKGGRTPGFPISRCIMAAGGLIGGTGRAGAMMKWAALSRGYWLLPLHNAYAAI